MLNRSACLAMSTYVLKALPGKLDIKRHSLSILYLQAEQRHNVSLPRQDDYRPRVGTKHYSTNDVRDKREILSPTE